MRQCLVILVSLALSVNTFSQSADQLIDQIQDLMFENYIFLDKAEEVNKRLDELMAEDYFDQFDDPQELAKAVTDEMRKITKDKHLGMNAARVADDMPEEKTSIVDNLARYARPMIQEVKYYDQNIGYFDMRYFGGAEASYKDVDMVMKRLENADAIIVDMRYNGGGSPDMARYLTSYFFDSRFLLNEIYSRATGHREEMWVEDVGGVKRPDIAVYILTSSRTFSGAEDFSYTMQQHKGRGIIVGEVTGGGAHPTRYFPLADGYGVSIPIARTINPVTKSNWEGVGVIPDVECIASEALDKALTLARVSAKEYKEAYFAPIADELMKLDGEDAASSQSETLLGLLKSAVDAGMLNEDDINLAGYQYLGEGKLNPSLAILESNTILFPNSVNVWDSYAEVLAADGQDALALENYNKAVELAEEQEHFNLDLYRQNRDGFKERMK